MKKELIRFLEKVKSDPKVRTFDEANTKQGVILPLFHLLGWDPFNVDEVKPEYSLENVKVDYALMINKKSEIFIEVKRPTEDLEKHQKQLLDYSFRQGVELAILTNGIVWWLYLPTTKGSWESRKFYAIDIIQQEAQDAALKFIDILSKPNVQSGESLKQAKSIHAGRLKKRSIDETMPEAWNRIIKEPDSLLVDMIAETTERICGYKPDIRDVKQMLKRNMERLLITRIVDQKPISKRIQVPPGPPGSKPFPPTDTLCRFTYMGQKYQGKIENGRLVILEMGEFSSFSGASKATTKTNRNGWQDWELQLPGTTNWILAHSWRVREKKRRGKI